MTDDTTHPQRSDRSRTVRLVVAALIVAALVAVALDNREEVEVGYVVGSASAPVWVVLVAAGVAGVDSASAPVWVVLVAAGVAGVIIGWLVEHRPRRG